MISPHMVSVAMASSVQISRLGMGPSSLNGFYLVRPRIRLESELHVPFFAGESENVYLQYFDKDKKLNIYVMVN